MRVGFDDTCVHSERRSSDKFAGCVAARPAVPGRQIVTRGRAAVDGTIATPPRARCHCPRASTNNRTKFADRRINRLRSPINLRLAGAVCRAAAVPPPSRGYDPCRAAAFPFTGPSAYSLRGQIHVQPRRADYLFCGRRDLGRLSGCMATFLDGPRTGRIKHPPTTYRPARTDSRDKPGTAQGRCEGPLQFVG